MKQNIVRKFYRVIPVMLLMSNIIFAKGDPDSGWVQLWDGETWDGLVVYPRGKALVTDLENQDRFSMQNGYIGTAKDGGNAHLFTIREYSYYHVRITYRFVEDGNAGLIVHSDLSQIDEPGFLDANENRPVSIEVNMKRDLPEEPWSLWMAKGLGPYVKTTVEPGTHNYLPEGKGGEPWTANHVNNANRVLFGVEPHNENPLGEWNYGEAILMGDSLGIFILNGQERTRAWDMTLSEPGAAERIPLSSGSIGLQFEGAEMEYKDWEVRSLIGCTDSTADNFGSWYVKDSIPTACEYTVKAKTPRDPKKLSEIATLDTRQKTLSISLPGTHNFQIVNTRGIVVYKSTGNQNTVHEFTHITRSGLYFFKLSTQEKGVYVQRQIMLK